MNALHQPLTLAGAAVLLYSCAATPQQLYWKTGISYAQQQSAVTSCEVKALQAVPRALATATTPSYTTPVYLTPFTTNCHQYGYGTSCTTTGGNVYGGHTYGGQTYTYDANAGLRERVIRQCLADQGYHRITLPVCSKSQATNAISLMAGELPFASTVRCITKDKSAYVPEIETAR